MSMPLPIKNVALVCRLWGALHNRHTFAKELVSNGVDISTVADLCGHADINVTRRYSKPTERDLETAIDKAFS